MKHLLSQLGLLQHTALGNWCPVRMGDELADAMGSAGLLGASRTSQQRRNTTYPGPDEDLTAWKTQVEIALRGITDPKTKLTLDHVLSSNPRYITVDAVAGCARASMALILRTRSSRPSRTSCSSYDCATRRRRIRPSATRRSRRRKQRRRRTRRRGSVSGRRVR